MPKSILALLLVCLFVVPANGGTLVTYNVDGLDYEGYRADADGASKGLVVLIHDWDGLTDYEIKRAEMIAQLGYDAFAVDLYGKGNRPTDTKVKKAQTAKLYNDREKMRALVLAGLVEARKSNDGAAIVMGYCFGGSATLELARSGKASDIAGYASFHGGLTTPEGQSYPNDLPPLLVAHGGADSSVTMDDVAVLSKDLESVGATYSIEVYSGAPHAFTVFGSSRYQERADKHSWDAFVRFMNANLAK